MKVYVCFDKQSKTWYAKWRGNDVRLSGKTADDLRVSRKLHSIKIGHKSDRLHSKADVRKSPEFKAIAARVGDGLFDAKQAKLLLAVAEARGKSKPDKADTELVERVVSDDTGKNMLLADFVEKVYLPYAATSLRGKTVREYQSIWTRYGMAEKVSGLRVSDFETHHGREILEAIAAQDVSKATVQHAKFFLSGVFVLAANKGTCKVNPMREVKLPEARGARETYAYSLDEIKAILALEFDAKTKAAIATAAFAALRESEIAGLHWDDYDGSEITVRRSIDRVTGEPNPPKTPKSAAPVPVIPTLQKLLDAYRVSASANEVMFPGVRQTYADLDKMALRVIRPALKVAGIQWCGWHAFRRGVASNLFQLGVDELTVQRILRHSKVQVTRERYIKVRDERAEQAMATFEAAIQNSSVLVQ
jgi:integrase